MLDVAEQAVIAIEKVRLFKEGGRTGATVPREDAARGRSVAAAARRSPRDSNQPRCLERQQLAGAAAVDLRLR